MKPHTDQKYLDALVNNDAKLIGEIYQNYKGMVTKLVTQNSGTLEQGEDHFQDVLLELRRSAKARGITLTCSFGSFLYTVAKRRWLNKLRKGVTFADLEGYENIGDETQLLAQASERVNTCLALIKKHLVNMGPRCQDFIKARIQGLKSKEIAAQFDTTVNFVNKKVSECFAKLRKRVKNDPDYNELCLD